MVTPNLAITPIPCSQEHESRDFVHSILSNFRDYGPIPVFITPNDAPTLGLSIRLLKSGIGAIFDLLHIEAVLKWVVTGVCRHPGTDLDLSKVECG